MKLPLPLRQLYPRCRWLRHLGGKRSTVHKRECVPDHLRALAHIEMYVIKGEPSALEAFIDWAREGPPRARVDDVEVADVPPTGDRGFRISG